MPIAYIQRTRERYAQFPPYKWVVNTDAPWTPLAKPLRECRVALVSSGGFYRKDQPAFSGDSDVSYRLIPSDTDLRDLRVYHHGYRDDDADRDPNCVLPLDRLRELATAGVIAEFGVVVSFVVTYSARRDVERGGQIAADLKQRGIDAALCVPV